MFPCTLIVELSLSGFALVGSAAGCGGRSGGPDPIHALPDNFTGLSGSRSGFLQDLSIRGFKLWHPGETKPSPRGSGKTK